MNTAIKSIGLSRIPAVEEILSVTESRKLPVIEWSHNSKGGRGRGHKAFAEPDLMAAFGAACEYIRTLEVALARMTRLNSR